MWCKRQWWAKVFKSKDVHNARMKSWFFKIAMFELLKKLGGGVNAISSSPLSTVVEC